MVLYFNPSCEMAVRHDGMSYSAPRLVAKMEEDLGVLMAYVGRAGDCVVGGRPDDELVGRLGEWGLACDFVSVEEGRQRVERGEEFVPWGMSRAALWTFGLRDRARSWGWRELLSRRTSVMVEDALGEMVGVGMDAGARVISGVGELESYRGAGGVVVKSLWSASGRGVRFFGDVDEARGYVERCIAADGGVVVERKLERVGERSLLYGVGDEGVAYVGVNEYRSGEGGGFGREIVGGGDLGVDWRWWGDMVGRALWRVIGGRGYRGAVGVDCMVYRDVEGRVRVRGCMEVNVRYCMGHVARVVSGLMGEGVVGEWGIVRVGGDGEWDSYCARMGEEYPLVMDADGRVRSGFVRLSGLGRGVRFGACGVFGERK